MLHVARVMQECSASLPGADRSLLTTLRPDERSAADLRDHEEWRRDIKDLQRSYDALRQSLSTLDPAILAMRSPSTAYGREWTFLQHVYGVVFHNV